MFDSETLDIVVSFYSWYGLILWGNTYETTLHAIIVLQKKAVRIVLLFLVLMLILPLFSNICTLWNFVMLYVILIVSLCLNFIIICYLLLFTIFLLLYQAGTTIILDCLLNQRFVFLLPGLIMESLTFVSRGLFFGMILKRL